MTVQEQGTNGQQHGIPGNTTIQVFKDKPRRSAPEPIRTFLRSFNTDESEAECVVLSRRRKIFVASVGKPSFDACFSVGRQGKHWLVPDGFTCCFVCKNKCWAGYINYISKPNGTLAGPVYRVKEINSNGQPIDNKDNVHHLTAHSAFKQVLEASSLGNPNNTNARLFFGVHNWNGQVYIRKMLKRTGSYNTEGLPESVQHRLQLWDAQFSEDGSALSPSSPMPQIQNLFEEMRRDVESMVETNLGAWEKKIIDTQDVDRASEMISEVRRRYTQLNAQLVEAMTGMESAVVDLKKRALNRQKYTAQYKKRKLNGDEPIEKVHSEMKTASNHALDSVFSLSPQDRSRDLLSIFSNPDQGINWPQEETELSDKFAFENNVNPFGSDQISEIEARALFDSINTDKNKYIDREEWVVYLVTKFGQPENVANKMFNEIVSRQDSQGGPDEKISFLDFAKYWKRREAELYKRFKMLDANDDDCVSVEELEEANRKKILNDAVLDDKDLEIIIGVLDHEVQDRKVTWNEFRTSFLMLPPFQTFSGSLKYYIDALKANKAKCTDRAIATKKVAYSCKSVSSNPICEESPTTKQPAAEQPKSEPSTKKLELVSQPEAVPNSIAAVETIVSGQQTGNPASQFSVPKPFVFVSFSDETRYAAEQLVVHLQVRFGKQYVLHTGDETKLPALSRFQQYYNSGTPCIWVVVVDLPKKAPVATGDASGAAAHALTMLAQSSAGVSNQNLIPQSCLSEVQTALRFGCPIMTVYATDWDEKRTIQEDLEKLPLELSQLAKQPSLPISDNKFWEDLQRIFQTIDVMVHQWVTRQVHAFAMQSNYGHMSPLLSGDPRTMQQQQGHNHSASLVQHVVAQSVANGLQQQ